MRIGLKLAPFRSSQTRRVPNPVPGLQEDFEIWQEDFDEMNDQVYQRLMSSSEKKRAYG